jgi:sodium ion-translocating decarboxylase beta subunit
MDKILNLWTGSGLYNMGGGQAVMIAVCLLLLFLAIRKGFEPLLLIPIGFGGLMANIPEAGLANSAVENAIHFAVPEVMNALASALSVPFQAIETATNAFSPEFIHDLKGAYSNAYSLDHKAYVAAVQVATDAGYANGMLYNFYSVSIASGVAPLLIFMGVGAMTDFGPLLANPKTLLLGAAAQFGIFGTVLGAALMTKYGIMDFTIFEAAAIGIIGGADGPTSIYVASLLAPHLLGAIAVAAIF